MFYIPTDWVRNKSNEPVIHDILNKHLYTDLNVNIDLVINELSGIGEAIVIEKLKNGTLMID